MHTYNFVRCESSAFILFLSDYKNMKYCLLKIIERTLTL